MANDKQKIVEEAAEWFVTLRDTREMSAEELQQQQEFSDWLKQSDEHVHEYLMISQLWGDVGELEIPADTAEVGAGDAEPDGVPGVESVECAESTQVTAAEQRSQFAVVAAPPVSARRQKRSRWAFYATAAGLLLVLSALFFWPSPARLYETGIGEQRTVTLEDGSTVRLNTLSAIQFRLEDEMRRVRLIRGEALFDVRLDHQRPFIVDTRVAAEVVFVKVLGTTFNIYQKDRETAVTVLEGTVLVAPGEYKGSAAPSTPDKSRQDADGGPDHRLVSGPQGGKDSAFVQQIELQVGQQAVLTAAEAGSDSREGQHRPIDLHVINDVDTGRITAWTERRLVFDGQSLAFIVEEFNRYNRRQLEIESPALASLKLSGVFSSNDPDSLILYISQIRDIKVMTRADGVRVIREQ